jgi:hypothetical protein
MRGKLISVFVACVLMGSALPLALGKKTKKDYNARLRALQKIYVDGSSAAVSYIRSNLSHETCLDNTPEESEADAVLEVWEVTPVRCEAGSPGICTSISAKLLDPKTNELLWFRSDDHLPMMDMIHQMNGPYQWILWNLKSSCCKGRPPAPPPRDSKP